MNLSVTHGGKSWLDEKSPQTSQLSCRISIEWYGWLKNSVSATSSDWKLSKTRNSEEDLEDENLELSSFNLSLGELGTARLVTSIRQDQNIRVVLEFENTSYQGHPLDCGQHAGTGWGGTPASEGMTLLFDLKGQVVYRFQTRWVNWHWKQIIEPPS